MKPLTTMLITLVFVIAVTAAAGMLFIRSGTFDIAATAEHGAFTNWVFRTTRRASVNRGERTVESRLPEALEGERLLAAAAGYADMCAACHVPPGGTETALARGLNPSPPDLTRAAGRYSPERLFWVTKYGIRMTGMPAWGVTHDDDDLWDLVAFIRMFPQMSGDEYALLLELAEAEGIEHHHHDHDHQHDAGNHHRH